MNDLGKTAGFLAVAVVLFATALWASIPRVTTVDDFRDLGQPFFPEFTDPSLCTSLEVFELDPTTAVPREFEVKQRDGRWVIPSHSDYPADAKDRLAQTAAQVIGLTKDTIRSSRGEDHAALGVLDPREAKTASVEGVGRRITLRDSSDHILADYILGKTVTNRPGQRYVRRPGQVRTYGVNVQVEPSTRFADWIEPNLLDLKAPSVVRAEFDNSKWDPDRRAVVPAPELAISREADGAPWTTPGLKPGEEVDPAKAAAMVQALANLKILGVRAKPKGLKEFLENPRDHKLDAAALYSMNFYGFRVGPDRHLQPDEGALLVTCNDGILYSLMFGRVTFAQGEALSAGVSEDLAKPEALPGKGDGAKKSGVGGEGAVESRFLFVTVSFDPKLAPQPKTESEVRAPGSLPKAVFRRTPAEIRAARARENADLEDWRNRVESGRRRAEILSRRFAPWYFVVPGDDYRTILLDRASLVHAKLPTEAAPRNPLQPGGMRLPNLPTGPRSVPGHPR